MLKIILYPFSFIYGIITEIRNILFNIGWLKSTRFNIPIVCVGNITVGGTGKTPHTEYAIKLLSKTHKVAVLSRGYGRKTKGFYWVEHNSKAIEVGDEPLQIKNKFGNIPIAVCENRIEGINRMIKEKISINLIILDDAFQHRAVDASTKILLIDYNRPIINDFPFPAGRLREFSSQKKRADIIIYTKCPENLSQQEQVKIESKYKLNKNQSFYFSYINYGNPININNKSELNIEDINSIILLTGIAQPKPLREYINNKTNIICEMIYPDHHNFSTNDVQTILAKTKQYPNSIVITTEKDASRLLELEMPENIKANIYYVPIEVSFFGKNKTFDNQLLHHVTNN